MTAAAVRAFMLTWFMAHHYSPVQAEAMIRQASIESNLQPCVRSSSGSWLYGWVGTRRRALAAYAGTGGCPTLEAQLGFADRELRGQPAFAGFWRAPPQATFAVLRQCFGRGQC
jgi:hypothetical protein